MASLVDPKGAALETPLLSPVFFKFHAVLRKMGILSVRKSGDHDIVRCLNHTALSVDKQ